MKNWQDRVLTCGQIREFDRIAIEQFGIPGIVLMENAARNSVQILRDETQSASVAIICGPGNNGGDGLAMARHLRMLEQEVHIFQMADPSNLSGDAAVNWQISQAFKIPTTVVNKHELETNLRYLRELNPGWIVDAMLGTGAKPPLRDPYASVVKFVNSMDSKRFAVDLPSGLQGDNQEMVTDYPVFRADITVTFVARKPVMTTKVGREFCGMVRVVDIGAPFEIINQI